uniref:Uncharacterized protein n=1 Tax=Arundo donax TaxID=35708 RepID=A0A0A8ZT27_ARUDO
MPLECKTWNWKNTRIDMSEYLNMC